MSYTNYDIEDDFYEFIRGDVYLKKPKGLHYQIIEEKGGKYAIIRDKNDSIKGFRLYNALDNNGKNGVAGEKAAAKFFDKNRIPFLYIGQGPTTLEKSKMLSEIQVRRPDFLIYTPTFGSMFWDVKARTKIMTKDSGDSQFYLFLNNEFENLKNVYKKLHLPLWIAYIKVGDAHKANKEKDWYPSFSLLSGSFLEQLWDLLNDNFDKEELSRLYAIRIPNELLRNNREKIDLSFELEEKIEIATKRFFIEQHKFILSKTEELVASRIKRGRVTKTELSRSIDQKFDFLLRGDVSGTIEFLIKRGVIEYVPNKPLLWRG